MAGNIGSNPFMEANMGYGTIVDNNLLPRGYYNPGSMGANYANPVDSALQRNPQKDEYTPSGVVTTVAKGAAIVIGGLVLFRYAPGSIKYGVKALDLLVSIPKKVGGGIANTWNKMFG